MKKGNSNSQTRGDKGGTFGGSKRIVEKPHGGKRVPLPPQVKNTG